ncbi:hypothetical protein PTSG_11128 [Salpingoeca rosetta]|uniref:Mediator complex subunit Med13 N-terminal domain-containing protein n=1 Tax=Salpingoeca rosetta (strain ATCC 50818 / BSB-021) TaxID=946362 RepID=F2US80_SALR5|nr:uncharacterized protein PTSG_11128 [Salpingoeca rosetta]EGD80485.1 hypothetical protein PTSG_11128 [Salpingoeca rosetta]|eukprot:XP_004988049.1 hypothetical protein PTSG_11128 [Salpingoeca rosetta]
MPSKPQEERTNVIKLGTLHDVRWSQLVWNKADVLGTGAAVNHEHELFQLQAQYDESNFLTLPVLRTTKASVLPTRKRQAALYIFSLTDKDPPNLSSSSQATFHKGSALDAEENCDIVQLLFRAIMSMLERHMGGDGYVRVNDCFFPREDDEPRRLQNHGVRVRPFLIRSSNVCVRVQAVTNPYQLLSAPDYDVAAHTHARLVPTGDVCELVHPPRPTSSGSISDCDDDNDASDNTAGVAAVATHPRPHQGNSTSPLPLSSARPAAAAAAAAAAALPFTYPRPACVAAWERVAPHLASAVDAAPAHLVRVRLDGVAGVYPERLLVVPRHTSDTTATTASKAHSRAAKAAKAAKAAVSGTCGAGCGDAADGDGSDADDAAEIDGDGCTRVSAYAEEMWQRAIANTCAVPGHVLTTLTSLNQRFNTLDYSHLNLRPTPARHAPSSSLSSSSSSSSTHGASRHLPPSKYPHGSRAGLRGAQRAAPPPPPLKLPWGRQTKHKATCSRFVLSLLKSKFGSRSASARRRARSVRHGSDVATTSPHAAHATGVGVGGSSERSRHATTHASATAASASSQAKRSGDASASTSDMKRPKQLDDGPAHATNMAPSTHPQGHHSSSSSSTRDAALAAAMMSTAAAVVGTSSSNQGHHHNHSSGTVLSHSSHATTSGGKRAASDLLTPPYDDQDTLKSLLRTSSAYATTATSTAAAADDGDSALVLPGTPSSPPFAASLAPLAVGGTTKFPVPPAYKPLAIKPCQGPPTWTPPGTGEYEEPTKAPGYNLHIRPKPPSPSFFTIPDAMKDSWSRPPTAAAATAAKEREDGDDEDSNVATVMNSPAAVASLSSLFAAPNSLFSAVPHDGASNSPSPAGFVLNAKYTDKTDALESTATIAPHLQPSPASAHLLVFLQYVRRPTAQLSTTVSATGDAMERAAAITLEASCSLQLCDQQPLVTYYMHHAQQQAPIPADPKQPVPKHVSSMDATMTTRVLTALTKDGRNTIAGMLPLAELLPEARPLHAPQLAVKTVAPLRQRDAVLTVSAAAPKMWHYLGLRPHAHRKDWVVVPLYRCSPAHRHTAEWYVQRLVHAYAARELGTLTVVPYTPDAPTITRGVECIKEDLERQGQPVDRVVLLVLSEDGVWPDAFSNPATTMSLSAHAHSLMVNKRMYMHPNAGLDAACYEMYLLSQRHLAAHKPMLQLAPTDLDADWVVALGTRLSFKPSLYLLHCAYVVLPDAIVVCVTDRHGSLFDLHFTQIRDGETLVDGARATAEVLTLVVRRLKCPVHIVLCGVGPRAEAAATAFQPHLQPSPPPASEPKAGFLVSCTCVLFEHDEGVTLDRAPAPLPPSKQRRLQQLMEEQRETYKKQQQQRRQHEQRQQQQQQQKQWQGRGRPGSAGGPQSRRSGGSSSSSAVNALGNFGSAPRRQQSAMLDKYKNLSRTTSKAPSAHRRHRSSNNNSSNSGNGNGGSGSGGNGNGKERDLVPLRLDLLQGNTRPQPRMFLNVGGYYGAGTDARCRLRACALYTLTERAWYRVTMLWHERAPLDAITPDVTPRDFPPDQDDESKVLAFVVQQLHDLAHLSLPAGRPTTPIHLRALSSFFK